MGLQSDSESSCFMPMDGNSDKENALAFVPNPNSATLLEEPSALTSEPAAAQPEHERLTARSLRRHTSSLPSSPSGSERVRQSLPLLKDPPLQQTAASGHSVDCWLIPWQQATEYLRANCGTQLRDINIVQDCKGADAMCAALTAMQIRYKYIAASDVKDSVSKLSSLNFPPEHLFKNARSLESSAACCCLTHPNAQCKIDYSNPRPDLYLAGFPCQPYTSLNFGNLSGPRSWTQHKLYYVTEDVIRFIKRRRPHKVLLENVVGMMVERDGDSATALAEILSQVDAMGGYVYKVLKLNSYTWIQMRRLRLFIILVEDVDGATEELARIVEVVKESYKFRKEYGPPVNTQELLLDEEDQVLKSDLRELEMKRKQEYGLQWKQQVKDLRKTVGQAEPWKYGDFAGVPKTPRNKAIINVSWLSLGGSAHSCSSPSGVKSGFVCDLSQNPCKRAWGEPRGLTTKTEWVNFMGKRRVVPRETFRFLGFPDLNFEGLSQHEIKDLAGESMSVPVLATLLGAILYGGRFDGLWGGGPSATVSNKRLRLH